MYRRQPFTPPEALRQCRPAPNLPRNIPRVRTPGFLPRAQVAIGIGYLALFVGFSLWARFDVPYRDDWDWILALLGEPGGLTGWFQPHNEHVIPLARLLMSAQLATGGLSGHLVQYVALGCQLAIIWIFWREVTRRWPDQQAWRWTVGGLVLVCLSFTPQLQSIVFAAAILFPLVQVWVTLAVVAWLNADEARASGSVVSNRQRVWWWASVVCVAGAVASTTSGIVAPVILGLLAWLRRGWTREVAGWGGVTVALALAYVAWVGLGVPAVETGVMRSVLVGVSGVAIAGIALVVLRALRRRGNLERIELFALAQIAFGLACTAMVLRSRAHFGLMQTAQSRYATFVLCVWAALVMFIASRASRGAGGETAPARPLLMGAVVLSVLLFVPNVYMGVLWWAKSENLNVAHLALRSGVPDPVWLKTLHPLTVVIDRTLQAMASRDMPVVDAVIHTTMTPMPTTTCTGEGRLVRQSRGGGLVFDGVWSSSLTHGVITDAGGAVVGLTGPAPWVREPAPSVTQVNAAVMRELRGLRAPATGARPWLGFAQAGRGGPYRFVGSDSTGARVCSTALTLTAAVHATLDRVEVDSDNVLRAAGWAFACGEDVAVWTLMIDGQPGDPVVVTALARVPRPDVAAAFADACAPEGPAGVHFEARPAVLSPGSHTATLRVVSVSGTIAESQPLTFVVPAGAAR